MDSAVEYLFPYEHPAATLAALLKEHGLRQVLFNSPPGDWKAGERGIAALPGREDEFRDGFLRALEYAHALQCPRIHAMAGVAPAGADRGQMHAVYTANLAWAAEKARAAEVDLLIEPIALRNIPGFFLNRQDEAHAIVAEIGAPNLKILMDLFHCQVEEGDLAIKITQISRRPEADACGPHPDRRRARAPRARHGRSELTSYLFDLIDELGYEGWIGCEYIPGSEGTSEGLGWLEEWKTAAQLKSALTAGSQSASELASLTSQRRR